MAYERKEIYTVEEIFAVVRPHIPRQKNIVVFDGDPIDMESQRYILFKMQGPVCCKCHLVGTYFAKERTIGQNATRWHFNLYGINKDGRHVLFTKDHIIPKSLGGKNHLSNYQVMCQICNNEKGNTYIIVENNLPSDYNLKQKL